MLHFYFPDVHVYEARNDYWSGEILKKISGPPSLYQKTNEEIPWGFVIHCNAENGEPYSVEFENGTTWSFCSLSERILKIEWPLLIKDYPDGNCKARVERIFSDSMYLTVSSDNALLNDMLIWHYPPLRLKS